MNSLEHRVIDGSSRAGVLTLLRERGGLLRVEDLSEAVGLSLSAVRFHLDRLISDGLVRTTKQPRLTPGRPRVMYEAMPEEAVDDAAAYRRLAGLMAGELAVLGGSEACERVGRAWAAQLLRSGFRADQHAGPVGAPESLSDVVAVLENGGFSPQILDGGWTLELSRCPFADLMPTQADVVCSVHRGLLRAVRGANGAEDQVRLYPARDAEGRCLVRFEAN